MTVKSTIKAILVAASVAGFIAPGLAQTPKRINQHKNWGSYSYVDAKSGKLCYILSIPEVKEPAERDHGDVFFLVSQKPGGAAGYEPQVEVGYPLKAESSVTVDVDGKKFAMFVQGNNAWLKDLTTEPQLIAAMKAGSRMTVSGQSSRGTQTRYTYSLSGVTAALGDVTACK